MLGVLEDAEGATIRLLPVRKVNCELTEGALEESASDVETVDNESKELMDDGTPLGKDMTVLLPVRLVDELSLSGNEVGAEVIDPDELSELGVLEGVILSDADDGGVVIGFEALSDAEDGGGVVIEFEALELSETETGGVVTLTESDDTLMGLELEDTEDGLEVSDVGVAEGVELSEVEEGVELGLLVSGVDDGDVVSEDDNGGGVELGVPESEDNEEGVELGDVVSEVEELTGGGVTDGLDALPVSDETLDDEPVGEDSGGLVGELEGLLDGELEGALEGVLEGTLVSLFEGGVVGCDADESVELAVEL